MLVYRAASCRLTASRPQHTSSNTRNAQKYGADWLFLKHAQRACKKGRNRYRTKTPYERAGKMPAQGTAVLTISSNGISRPR